MQSKFGKPDGGGHRRRERRFEAEVEPSCKASLASRLAAVIGEARGVLRRRLSRVAKQVRQAGWRRSSAKREDF